MFNSDASVEIKFFGWAFNEAENNDKIWGWVVVEGKLYNFWGRRADLDAEKGKKLSFKRHEKRWGTNELHQLTRKKMYPSGGKTPYRSIPCTQDYEGRYTDIEKVYPNFGAHFKKQLMFARLTGTVMNEVV